MAVSPRGRYLIPGVTFVGVAPNRRQSEIERFCHLVGDSQPFTESGHSLFLVHKSRRNYSAVGSRRWSTERLGWGCICRVTRPKAASGFPISREKPASPFTVPIRSYQNGGAGCRSWHIVPLSVCDLSGHPTPDFCCKFLRIGVYSYFTLSDGKRRRRAGGAGSRRDGMVFCRRTGPVEAP